MKCCGLCCGVLTVSTLLMGCGHAPGGPQSCAEVARPDEIIDFTLLYAHNCSGCHGTNGLDGPAIALANPAYEAIVDDQTLREVITNGERGTLMPAFAKSAGGTLTDLQINMLVKGIRSHWYKADALKGLGAPPYRSDKPRDVVHGEQLFKVECTNCHGFGTRKARAGSVTDGSYLALMSDQTLRAIIIAGRPDIGQPDWRSVEPGHPLSDQDVTDLVAWIASQRDETSGQPNPSRP